MEILTVLLKSHMNNTEFPVHLQVTIRKLFEIQTVSDEKTTMTNETHVILDSKSWHLGFWCIQRLCGWKSYLPPKEASPFLKTKLKQAPREEEKETTQRNSSPPMEVGS